MHTDIIDYVTFTSQYSSMPGGNTVSGFLLIVDDNVEEDTESFSLHVHNCTNTVAGCSIVTAQYSLITITDNDNGSKYIAIATGFSSYKYTCIHIHLAMYCISLYKIISVHHTYMVIQYQCRNSF